MLSRWWGPTVLSAVVLATGCAAATREPVGGSDGQRPANELVGLWRLALERTPQTADWQRTAKQFVPTRVMVDNEWMTTEQYDLRNPQVNPSRDAAAHQAQFDRAVAEDRRRVDYYLGFAPAFHRNVDQLGVRIASGRVMLDRDGETMSLTNKKKVPVRVDGTALTVRAQWSGDELTLEWFGAQGFRAHQQFTANGPTMTVVSMVLAPRSLPPVVTVRKYSRAEF